MEAKGVEGNIGKRIADPSCGSGDEALTFEDRGKGEAENNLKAK